MEKTTLNFGGNSNLGPDLRQPDGELLLVVEGAQTLLVVGDPAHQGDLCNMSYLFFPFLRVRLFLCGPCFSLDADQNQLFISMWLWIRIELFTLMLIRI
jgi:hypothetical protein